MIPKVIHYCWFGRNPLPELALKCIESWKKYLPDYEIKEWNEDNFDVNMIPYTAEAYAAKKYAYVSDYARLWVLYHHGGIYFDTDVEVIQPIDDILARGPFMGCEKDASELGRYPDVNPGVGMAACPEMPFIKGLMDIYAQLGFNSENQNRDKGVYKTIVEYTSELLLEKGLVAQDGVQEVDGFIIYPKEYFNPLHHVNQLSITPNTRSIHHYAGTWISSKDKLKKRIIKLLGARLYGLILKLR